MASVLIGNAIYCACSPVLPPPAQHNFNSLDLGLLVDFWMCLFVLGILRLWYRLKHRAGPPH